MLLSRMPDAWESDIQYWRAEADPCTSAVNVLMLFLLREACSPVDGAREGGAAHAQLLADAVGF